MTKFPLLEQLRAERQRQEEEISAPYRAELSEASRMILGLRASLRAIERVLGTEIGQHVVREISDSLSRELRRMVTEAAMKAQPTDPAVTLTLPVELVRFMDPKSLSREILERYVDRSLPALDLRVSQEPDMAASVTTFDIQIPPLGFRSRLSH